MYEDFKLEQANTSRLPGWWILKKSENSQSGFWLTGSADGINGKKFSNERVSFLFPSFQIVMERNSAMNESPFRSQPSLPICHNDPNPRGKWMMVSPRSGSPVIKETGRRQDEAGRRTGGQHNQNDYSSPFGLKPRVSRITWCQRAGNL